MGKIEEKDIKKNSPRPCEVCGHTDHIVGVTASTLGVLSFNLCGICMSMRAEPKWAIDDTIELCDGLKNIKDVPLTYYDRSTDRYVDVRKGFLPIKTNSGEQFDTRAGIVKHLAEKYPEHVARMTIEEDNNNG